MHLLVVIEEAPVIKWILRYVETQDVTLPLRAPSVEEDRLDYSQIPLTYHLASDIA